MISSLFANLFGLTVFAGLLCGIWKANARRWNRLARRYSAANYTEPPGSETRRMQTIILTGGNVGWNSYKGIATVAVTTEGLLFRIMPLFSVFHSPLLVPFRDIGVTAKKWYLIGQSVQLTFESVHDVQMIIDPELMEWIREQSRILATEFANSQTESSTDDVPESHHLPQTA